MRGIDTDNYDGDIPLSHFQLLHDAHDVMFNIIGLEAAMPYAQAQRENSNRAGIATPFAYKFLYWTANDIERMKRTAGFGLPIAIDCEYETNLGPDAVIDRIAEARDVLIAEGLYWGIYTGEWWWPGNTRNSKAFKDDNLWHAAYPFGGGNLPPYDYNPTSWAVKYGGWTQATVLQYADRCYGDDLGPWALDLNAWNPAMLPQQPPSESTGGFEDMKWVTWADRPEPTTFRSYLIGANLDGLVSRFVPNIEEHRALEESGVAGPLLSVSIETLRQFGCSPDPAS